MLKAKLAENGIFALNDAAKIKKIILIWSIRNGVLQLNLEFHQGTRVTFRVCFEDWLLWLFWFWLLFRKFLFVRQCHVVNFDNAYSYIIIFKRYLNDWKGHRISFLDTFWIIKIRNFAQYIKRKDFSFVFIEFDIIWEFPRRVYALRRFLYANLY